MMAAVLGGRGHHQPDPCASRGRVTEAGRTEAPVVAAKGQELVAACIREIARAHRVLRGREPPVARLLHQRVGIGQEIPAELFKAVAEILAYVYSLRTTKR